MSTVDLRKIKKLIEMVEASGISELEVRNGEESIRIVRPLAPAATVSQRTRETTRRRRAPRHASRAVCRARAVDGNVLLRAGAR